MLSCFLTGQWSCSTCLVSNPADKKECLACGTAPPTSSTKEPPKATATTSNWGDLLPNTTGMSAGSCEFTLTVLLLVFCYGIAEKEKDAPYGAFFSFHFVKTIA